MLLSVPGVHDDNLNIPQIHGGKGEEGEESDVVYVVDVTTESRLTCSNAFS